MKSWQGDSPQLALDLLDEQQITFARELRGLTKKELASKISKTPSAVSQMERGLIKPDLETLVRISMTLRVPTTFFVKRSDRKKSIRIERCFFRSKRSTSQAERKQSARNGDLLINLIELLEQKGTIFPAEKITMFARTASSPTEIERAASDLRRHWGMGLGPIPSIVKLVESKGIIVLPLYKACEKVDAYSTWRSRRPCMLLSFSKTASRARFDVAHELGHLVIHEDASAGEGKVERQANRFAGAFLAPRESFVEECPRSWSLSAFRRLKDRWKISISAMLYRAKDLGKISASTYQRAMIDLNRRGLLKFEGDEWPMEQPTLINQALELLSSKVTLEQLAHEIGIYSSGLRELLFSCVTQEVLDKIDRKTKEETVNIVSLRKT
jgi:Zn-dependent peptidase ImmA (M78 family)/transcriptional regulator with XRE-family HTH domain